MEDGLKFSRAEYPDESVPRGLQRELLEEALQTHEILAKHSLLGNRLAAICLDGQLFVCRPTGQIGQTLSLSVLAVGSVGKFQVRTSAASSVL